MTCGGTRIIRALSLVLALLLLTNVGEVDAADDRSLERSVSANDFGGIGLLQTRTARFGSDGSFEAGTTFIDPYRRWYFRLTLVPWFEGTFRYTDVRNRLFSNIFEFSGNQTFKDRSADIKFRLWPESRYAPTIAVGFQDGLGTGLFESEYLVASKRFRDLDLSFGIAWGYLGNGGTWTNPLIRLSNTFRSRSAQRAEGGSPAFGAYFSGETVAPFFGLEYRTPIERLTLKAEYEGNDYKTEPLGNVLEATSRWNYGLNGLNYRPFSWLDVSLAFERGNSYMSRLALLADLHDPGLPKFDPPPPPIKVRSKIQAPTNVADGVSTRDKPRVSSHRADERLTATSSEQNNRTIEELFVNLERAGLDVAQFEFTHEEARVHFTHGLEGSSVGEAERLARMVVDLVPTPVERVAFVDDRQAAE